MYHDITPSRVEGGGGPARFAVPLAEFERQLDQLKTLGRSGRSLRGALADRGANAVAITFDDGDAGQAERGFRALAERGMTATFFVTTDWIGRPGYASWDQLREMRAAGMDVQSHTRSHPFLAELDAAALTAELRGAKDTLDRELGQDTDMLALPGGSWPRKDLRHLIASAGYRVVATSRWGRNGAGTGSGGFAVVQRCTVAGEPGPEMFGRIATGDAWLAGWRTLRESTLGAIRSSLGPTRYAKWRRKLLDAVRGPRRTNHS